MDDTETGSDGQLIARIAQGSEEALAQFYNCYESLVYAFAMRRLQNEFEAAECLNEVMLEVWNHARSYEGRSKVKYWLLGIANFKVLDKLRKRYRHSTDELDDQIPDNDAISAMDIMSAADDSRIVQNCLNGLSDSHRQVLHLAFFEDLSYEEIAEIAACPEGTVKTRVFHAKIKIKECLKNYSADLFGRS